jgi:hypothetical protein
MDARGRSARRGDVVRRLLSCAAALVLLLAAGCATVSPWERETLSHSEMAQEPNPEAARFDAKVAGAHEGALNPDASGGGGCGCN